MDNKFHNCAFCGRHSCDKVLTHGAWGICLLYLGTNWSSQAEAEKSICGDWEPMSSKAVCNQLEQGGVKIINAN